MRQLALGCESSGVKSTHDAYENTWKCGELKLYFSPSAGGLKKNKNKQTNKHTPSLRGEVLGADTTGPAVARVGTIQLNWVSFAYCPKRNQFDFRKSKGTVLRVGVGHQPKARKNLHQQGERRRRALAESILQVGATREVEAEPVAG